MNVIWNSVRTGTESCFFVVQLVDCGKQNLFLKSYLIKFSNVDELIISEMPVNLHDYLDKETPVWPLK